LLLRLAWPVCAAPPIVAKNAIIRWQSVQGAIRYELEIQSDEKETIVDEMLPPHKTTWNGTLPPGFYEYRVRAFDWAKRPGLWTKPGQLVVEPPSPRLVYPGDGEVLVSVTRTEV